MSCLCILLLCVTFLAQSLICPSCTSSTSHSHTSLFILTITYPHPLSSPSTRGNDASADLFNLWIVVLKCPPPEGAKPSSAFTHPEAHVFHSTCSSQASVSCSGWLEAGFYVVIPFSFLAWQSEHEEAPNARTRSATTGGLPRPTDYLLSVFSSRPLILDKVHLRPGFVAQSIHLLAKKVGKRIQVSGAWLS